VFDDLGQIEIVETAALQFAARKREAGRVDNVNGDAEAGAEPEQGTGVLRDIGLVEGEFDRHAVLLVSRGR